MWDLEVDLNKSEVMVVMEKKMFIVSYYAKTYKKKVILTSMAN